MDAETLREIADEEADRLAEQVASFDEALADGREPSSVCPNEVTSDGLQGPSAARAARDSPRMIEHVWPRSLKSGGPDPLAIVSNLVKALPPAFGRFQIVRELGQGGFGIVFLAMDPKLGRSVALKIPQPGALLDLRSRTRFMREARAAAGLDHPNIVPLYEAGEVGPVCYLASAYCEGPTLAAWVRNRAGPVPPRLAARIVVSLAGAMQYAHERGVLHRDLKPSNVLLQRAAPERAGASSSPCTSASPCASSSPCASDEDEPDFVARIIDFGLARLMDLAAEETTASFAAAGSAPYMAPEQVEGKKVGPATDVYGLGAVLYAILCGRAPHRGVNGAETMRRVVNDEPAPPRRGRPDVARDLEAICLKCLEKSPERRYQSARALAEDLERFLSGRTTAARPTSALDRAWRVARRRPERCAVLALWSGLLVAGLLGVRWYEARLDVHRHVTRELDRKIGRHSATLQREHDDRRRIQYVADVRLAAQLANNQQTIHAIRFLERNRPRPGEADLREFAWRHLMRRCHTETRTLNGHCGEVYHVEFSPNGALLATAGMDGTVRLWNISTWEMVRSIGASETEVNAAVFSPDGAALATVDDTGRLKLWETITGRCLWTTVAHVGEALHARFPGDGQRIVTLGRADRLVKIWGRSNGALLDTFPADGFFLGPDGVAIATLGEHGELEVRHSSTNKQPIPLRLGDEISSAAFSRDGRWLATAHRSDGTVRLWDVTHRRLRHEFRRHGGGMITVAFATHDRTMISAGADGTIRFWDVETGSPRGAHHGHADWIWSAAVSPDGRTIASASRDGTVKIWSAKVPEVPARFSATGELMDLAFSPDGRSLIGIGSDGMVSTWCDGSERPRTAWRATAPGSIVTAVLSRDGRVAAVRTRDQSIELFDLRARRPLGTVHSGPSPGAGPGSLAFDADGRRLAVASQTGGASLWNVPEPKKLAAIGGNYTHVLFASADRVLCRSGPRGSVVSWRLSEGRTTRLPSLEWGPAPASASFAPGGGVFAAPDGKNVRIGSLAPRSGPESVALMGHVHNVKRLAFSPDGKTLASGDQYGMVKLWDVAAREELLAFGPCPGTISSLRFSPDGDALAACGVLPDGTTAVFLWRATNDGPSAVPRD